MIGFPVTINIQADERERAARRQEIIENDRSKRLAAEKRGYNEDIIYLATHPTRNQSPKSLSQYVEPDIYTEPLQEEYDSTAITNIRTGWASDY